MQVTPFRGAAPIPYAAAAAVQAGGRYFQESILPGLIDRYFHSRPRKFTPYTNSTNTTSIRSSPRTMPYRYASRRRGRRRGSRFSARYRAFGHRTRMVPRRRRPLRSRRTFKSVSRRKSKFVDMANNRSGPLFYPFKLNAKFHFFHEETLDPAATLVDFFSIRTANAFSPIDGNSHQPRGWAQLKDIYSNYEVIGMKIRVTFRFDQPDEEVEQNPVICFITRDDSGTYYPVIHQEFYEKAITNTKWKKLVYNKNTSTTISMYCPAKEFFADKSATQNVAVMTAAPAATPHCNIGVVYPAVNGAKVVATTHCTFYTRLSKPIDLVPASTAGA